MSGIDTKAIREAAASYVFWSERAKETPSALIRWTIPGLCDRVEELEERLRAVEAIADELAAYRGLEGQRGGRWARRLRAALAPATSPAEQEVVILGQPGIMQEGGSPTRAGASVPIADTSPAEQEDAS